MNSPALTQNLDACADIEQTLSPARLWALVPVKGLSGAKQRLQNFLGQGRIDFTLAMLADVLDALADSKVIKQVAVVTADPRVAAMAIERGLMLVEETSGCDMNAAIALGVTAIRRNEGQELVIIPSDIPLLTGPELDRLAGQFLAQSQSSRAGTVGISPSADLGGTNCLFLDAGEPFEFHYGPDSFKLHCDGARLLQHAVVRLESPTVSMDMDEPRDVEGLLEFYQQHPEFQQSRTWKFLQARNHQFQAATMDEV